MSSSPTTCAAAVSTEPGSARRRRHCYTHHYHWAARTRSPAGKQTLAFFPFFLTPVPVTAFCPPSPLLSCTPAFGGVAHPSRREGGGGGEESSLSYVSVSLPASATRRKGPPQCWPTRHTNQQQRTDSSAQLAVTLRILVLLTHSIVRHYATCCYRCFALLPSAWLFLARDTQFVDVFIPVAGRESMQHFFVFFLSLSFSIFGSLIILYSLTLLLVDGRHAVQDIDLSDNVSK